MYIAIESSRLDSDRVKERDRIRMRYERAYIYMCIPLFVESCRQRPLGRVKSNITEIGDVRQRWRQRRQRRRRRRSTRQRGTLSFTRPTATKRRTEEKENGSAVYSAIREDEAKYASQVSRERFLESEREKTWSSCLCIDAASIPTFYSFIDPSSSL